MTDPRLSGLPPELLAAVCDASAIITIGPHPTSPGLGVSAAWFTDDVPGGPIPPAAVVAKLRAIADDIEHGVVVP